MKRRRLLFRLILLCVLVFGVGLLTARIVSRFTLPKPDNETPYSELISRKYSAEELLRLRECESLRDAVRNFRIECVRDPGLLNEKAGYLPYFVLLSDTDEKSFVFFSKETKELEWITRFYALPTEKELRSYALQMEADSTNIDKWWEALKGFCVGPYTGNLHQDWPVVTREGVLVISLRRKYGVYVPAIDSFESYSDWELLYDNSAASNIAKHNCDIYPILPIDKQEHQGKGEST